MPNLVHNSTMYTFGHLTQYQLTESCFSMAHNATIKVQGAFTSEFANDVLYQLILEAVLPLGRIICLERIANVISRVFLVDGLLQGA